MSTAFLAFGVVFLAEFGDKTEIVTLALVARYGALPVLLGVSLATCLISAASVLVGGFLHTAIPNRPTAIAAGLVFLVFAAWTLRRDDVALEGAKHPERSLGGAVAVTAATFLLTEFGDKTMLATVTLAARGELLEVWLGATLGVIAADGIAIAIGQSLRDRISPRLMRVGSGIAFGGVGTILLAEGLLH